MKLSNDVAIDLPVLLESRLLVQANSGGGKSWALRRLLEQTADKVQQLVIDPEGEFATLRERFDYVIAAPHDGDAVATPKTAALLARRLLEAGVSAILNIYDLKAHERQSFVRLFLEALTNAPRALWHPVLIVLDEAHTFAPQVGSAEASSAVIDVATRGRKRGQGLVLATQRLSKLHKDAAAEMLNKLIGRTGLDVDVKRAADELGLTARDAMDQLRALEPGEFFAFGPALSPTVRRTRIGPIVTTHPKPGQRLMQAPPAASKALLGQLAKLADLQREAEQEARTVEELRAENAKLKREVTIATKRATEAGVPEAEVERRIRAALAAVPKYAPMTIVSDDAAQKALRKIAELAAGAISGEPQRAPRSPLRATTAAGGTALPAPPREGVGALRKGAVRILQELAARSPAGYSRAQVGALTGFTPSGGTFQTYIGDLKRSGAIEERDGLVYATESGCSSLGSSIPKAPTTHEEAMALWRRALRAGAFRMLEAVVDAGPAGISRDAIADAVGMTSSGGTFQTYLGDLRRNGLVLERNGRAIANDILFPRGAP